MEAEAASRAKAADVLALSNQALALEKQLEGAQREVAAVEAAAHAAWAARAQHVSEHGQASWSGTCRRWAAFHARKDT